MPKENPYGDVLIEIEGGLIDHDIRVNDDIAEPYVYTDEQFRACLKIFMNSLLWKMWEYQEATGVVMSEKAGIAIKDLVLEFTGIDTHKLYDTGGNYEN